MKAITAKRCLLSPYTKASFRMEANTIDARMKLVFGETRCNKKVPTTHPMKMDIIRRYESRVATKTISFFVSIENRLTLWNQDPRISGKLYGDQKWQIFQKHWAMKLIGSATPRSATQRTL